VNSLFVKTCLLMILMLPAGCAAPPALPPPPDNRQYILAEEERAAEQHLRLAVLIRDHKIGEIVRLLNYPDPSVVAASTEALVRLDDPSVAEALERRLDKAVSAGLIEMESGRPLPEQPVRSLTHAVAHFTRPESAVILGRALRLPIAQVRHDSVVGIAESRSVDAYRLLLKAFNSLVASTKARDTDTDAELPEYMVIESIGRLRTVEAMKFLQGVLQHKRHDLRIRAGRALAPYHHLFPGRFDPLRFRVPTEGNPTKDEG